MDMWNKVSGSVISPYHVYRELPNQDSGESLMVEDSILTTVSDGAGSLLRSDVGSQIAVASVCEKFKESPEVSEENMVNILSAGREEVLERDDAELGCTLAIAIANEESWVMGTIGDSFSIVMCSDALHHSTSEPGEFANVTQLVTSKNPKFNITSGTGYVQGIAASSDGLDHSTFKNGRPLENFWKKVFRDTQNQAFNLEKFFRYLSSKDLIDDDTTLELFARNET